MTGGGWPVALAGPMLWASFLGVAHAAEVEAWVPRERAEALRNVLTFDHGAYRDDGGLVWVAVRGDAAILDRMPATVVRGRRPVPSGPPPAGYALPDGTGATRLLASVDGAPRSGLVRAGTSVEGRPIWAAWFGQRPEEGAPSVWVLGAHHGDEASSYEQALRLAEDLSVSDGVDGEVTSALDERTVWVVPYVNPDGAMIASRWNAQRTDLNRNYGAMWSDEENASGDGPWSAPESRAIRALGEVVRPMAGLALHAGAENIGFVWNHTEEPAPDAWALRGLGDAYAATCGIDDFWVTNGAAWYVTRGDSNDWSYTAFGTWEYTLELSIEKLPRIDDLPGVLANHELAVLDFVLQPLESVVVRDAATGEPMEARVVVDGGQPRWTVPVSGRVGFPRGASSIEVGAPGYQTVWASPGQTVQLEPVAVAPGLADPPWIRGRSEVRFPGRGPWRRLTQPGEAPVVVAVDALGRGVVRAGSMRPGMWTIEDPSGAVFLRALGVGAEGWSDGRGGLWLPGDGHEGARAFALSATRNWIEVPVTVSDAGVSIASPGPVVWVGDGERRLLVDSLPFPDQESVVVRGAACAQPDGMGHLAATMVSVLGVALRRRRRRGDLG